MYLPVGCPKWNPEEKAFSVLKNALRRDQDLGHVADIEAAIYDKVYATISPELMTSLFTSSGL